MKIMSIVGARPNFMKAAPIISAIDKHNDKAATGEMIQHLLVHTGQHYDENEGTDIQRTQGFVVSLCPPPIRLA